MRDRVSTLIVPTLVATLVVGPLCWEGVAMAQASAPPAVAVTPGPAQPKLRLKYRWPRWLPWTIVGAGVVIAVVGVPLIVTAGNKFAEYDREYEAVCSQGCLTSELPRSIQDLETTANSYRYSGYAMFALGGATLVTGLVMAILNRPRIVTDQAVVAPDRPRFAITPTVLPGGGYLQAKLRF